MRSPQLKSKINRLQASKVAQSIKGINCVEIVDLDEKFLSISEFTRKVNKYDSDIVPFDTCYLEQKDAQLNWLVDCYCNLGLADKVVYLRVDYSYFAKVDIIDESYFFDSLLNTHFGDILIVSKDLKHAIYFLFEEYKIKSFIMNK